MPTVASRVVLVIYNWEQDHLRYQRNAEFVQTFFSHIDEFPTLRGTRNGGTQSRSRVCRAGRARRQDWLPGCQTRAAGAKQTAKTAGGVEQKAPFDTFVERRAKQFGASDQRRGAAHFSAEFQKFWQSQQDKTADMSPDALP